VSRKSATARARPTVFFVKWRLLGVALLVGAILFIKAAFDESRAEQAEWNHQEAEIRTSIEQLRKETARTLVEVDELAKVLDESRMAIARAKIMAEEVRALHASSCHRLKELRINVPDGGCP
jgi:uncharacterized protein YlxW (UPF0749 family)